MTRDRLSSSNRESRRAYSCSSSFFSSQDRQYASYRLRCTPCGTHDMSSMYRHTVQQPPHITTTSSLLFPQIKMYRPKSLTQWNPAQDDNLPNTANTITATTHLFPGNHPLLACGIGCTAGGCKFGFVASFASVSGLGVAVDDGTEDGAVESVESDWVCSESVFSSV